MRIARLVGDGWTALAVWLLAVASAKATTVSYIDGVFRYRGPVEGGDFAIFAGLFSDGGDQPTHVGVQVSSVFPVEIGPGCELRPLDFVICVLAGADVVRYRVSLGSGADRFVGGGDTPRLTGVVFAGAGSDEVAGRRAYGGPGNDSLSGWTLFGGPGNDRLFTGPQESIHIRGGPGNDAIEAIGNGTVYGGPGRDSIMDRGFKRGEFTGGPGRDLIGLEGAQDDRVIVRLRGGGSDRIVCGAIRTSTRNVLIVDRSDVIQRRCLTARVLYRRTPAPPPP
jgi:hypothetical protein